MIMPLSGVSIASKYDEVKFEGEGTFDSSALGSEETLSIMAPHQNTTAPCQRGLNMNASLKSGIVTIAVSYSPFSWPSKRPRSAILKQK